MKDEGTLNTIVGKGSTITGNLDIQGSVRVDGTVSGDVKCSDLLTVGSTGRIMGNVTVKQIVLAGSVSGNIFASEKAELQNKAMIEGDITTRSLIVEAGAILHGQCNMRNGSKSASHISMAEKKDK